MRVASLTVLGSWWDTPIGTPESDTVATRVSAAVHAKLGYEVTFACNYQLCKAGETPLSMGGLICARAFTALEIIAEMMTVSQYSMYAHATQ